MKNVIEDITYHEICKSFSDGNFVEVMKKKATILGEEFLSDLYNRPIVYMLIKNGRDPKIIYVGQTKMLARRILDHKRMGKDFDRVVCYGCEESEVSIIEALAIRYFKPPLNDNIPPLEVEKKLAKKCGMGCDTFRKMYNPNDDMVFGDDNFNIFNLLGEGRHDNT